MKLGNGGERGRVVFLLWCLALMMIHSWLHMKEFEKRDREYGEME